MRYLRSRTSAVPRMLQLLVAKHGRRNFARF